MLYIFYAFVFVFIFKYPLINEALPFVDPWMVQKINNTVENGTLQFGISRGSGKFLVRNKGEKLTKIEFWAAKHVYPYITKNWLLTSKDLISEMNREIIPYGVTSKF